MINEIKKETKLCKSCGRNLPLDEFVKKYGNVTSVCLKCSREKQQETKFNNKLETREITEKDFVVIKRSYKKIANERAEKECVGYSSYYKR